MIEKDHGKFLDTLDFILNKLMPKKYIVVLLTMVVTLIMEWKLKVKVPELFYYVIISYISGSAVVQGARNIRNKGGKDEGP